MLIIAASGLQAGSTRRETGRAGFRRPESGRRILPVGCVARWYMPGICPPWYTLVYTLPSLPGYAVHPPASIRVLVVPATRLRARGWDATASWALRLAGPWVVKVSRAAARNLLRFIGCSRRMRATPLLTIGKDRMHTSENPRQGRLTSGCEHEPGILENPRVDVYASVASREFPRGRGNSRPRAQGRVFSHFSALFYTFCTFRILRKRCFSDTFLTLF